MASSFPHRAGDREWNFSIVDLDGNPAVSGQLCPGEYLHTTTDQNGCLATDTVIIVGPDSIQFTFTTTNVPCNGADNGFICLDSLQGGTGPLVPALVPAPPATSLGADNCFTVPAGTYSVLVEDSLGCVSSFYEAVVEEPENIQILPCSPISCFGAEDGMIILNAVGGIGPLSLASQFPFFTLPDTLVGLGPDTLNIVVADSLGCADSLLVSIPEPEPVSLEVLSTLAPECGEIVPEPLK